MTDEELLKMNLLLNQLIDNAFFVATRELTSQIGTPLPLTPPETNGKM